ncbi:MAG: hypothetical protein KGQ59_03825 [Bdellovibrionales bacterium]|nr:hypothetical protein [Bdellovibrionales bacterium]
MKRYIYSGFLLGLPVVLGACFLDSKGESKALTSEIGLALTPNFSSPTGWLTTDGAPIAIAISLSGAPADATLECRTAPVSVVQSVDFAPCPSATEVAPNKHNNQHTGTYRTEVRAMSGGAMVAEQFVDYYVHPSLNSKALCTTTRTDADYFQIAGAVLDQSTVFGDETSLTAPKITLQFATEGSPRSRALTLRKRLTMNESRTLVVLKRRFVRNDGTCGVPVPALVEKRTLFGVKSVTDEDWLNNKAFLTKSRSSLYNAATNVWTEPSTSDPILGTEDRWDRFISRITEQDSNENRIYPFHVAELTERFYNRSIHCEAVVLNAIGQSVCIRSDGQISVAQTKAFAKKKAAFGWLGSAEGLPTYGMFSAKVPKHRVDGSENSDVFGGGWEALTSETAQTSGEPIYLMED